MIDLVFVLCQRFEFHILLLLCIHVTTTPIICLRISKQNISDEVQER